MKKILCAILTAIIMVTMVCPVMAAEVNVGNSDVTNLFTKLETMMPTEPLERVQVWRTFKAYMLDGTNGIDTIIKAVNGQIVLPDTDAGFKDFIDEMQNESQATKDGFIFLLNMYKSVPVANRAVSLNLFGGAGDTETTEIEMTKLPLTVEQEAAARTMYDRYVPVSLQNEFKEHYYIDGVNAALDVDNFLLLLTAFNGQFMMTDSVSNDFALAYYDKDFAEHLAAYNDLTSINGVTIATNDTLEAEGYDILCGIVEFVNTFSDDIANLKVVLAHDDINLYEPHIAEAIRPSTNGGGGITGGGGNTMGGGQQQPVVPTPPPVKFPDIVGHWAEDVIRDLEARGILAGYEDGEFKPDIGVTRQEVAVIMTRALGLTEKAASDGYWNASTGFADDHSIADWARGSVNLMIEMGIYTGYDDGEFKPNKTILRQELIAVVMRYAAMTEAGMETAYDDSHEIHGYAESFIAHASELGIVNGYPDGTFKPLNNVTRAEAAKIIYGVIEYYKEIGKLN